MAIEFATLIYLVLDIQDIFYNFYDSCIIYWTIWTLNRSFSVYMFLFLFKLKRTKKSFCNIGKTLITLTHILYLYNG